MALQNTLKLYTVERLLKDPSFIRRICTLSRQCVGSSDNVTVEQIQNMVDHPYTAFKGNFIADGDITEITINHNLNIDNGNISDPFRYEPYSYSITTSQPISNNHLNRTITFPDANKMLITFTIAPNSGEDARYIVNIFK